MDRRKCFYIADGASLPFIRERPSQYQSQAKIQDIISPRITDDEVHPRLRLRELTGRPILQWPIQLPTVDPRGVPMGRDFECWKKAREGRTGISGNWYSIKTGRMNACHSMLEARIHAYLDMCPFVVEFRTQYPSWSQEEYARYYESQKRFPKNKVMTIDFMITLRLPGSPHYLYHGISGKRKADIAVPKTIRRHGREVSQISAWGSTHEVMDEFAIPDREFDNYLLLKQWFLWTDIAENMDAAYEFAHAVKQSNAKGSLDRVLVMIGRRFGHDRDASYRLLGVAVFLGYLWLDHRFRLNIDLPLVLLPLLRARNVE